MCYVLYMYSCGILLIHALIINYKNLLSKHFVVCLHNYFYFCISNIIYSYFIPHTYYECNSSKWNFQWEHNNSHDKLLRISLFKSSFSSYRNAMCRMWKLLKPCRSFVCKEMLISISYRCKMNFSFRFYCSLLWFQILMSWRNNS